VTSTGRAGDAVPLEAAERRRRDLASAAKRLRVAAMSDPGRSVELAETLVELVGSRLLAWSFAEAAADAPESVVLSARILAERGPIGPYASADDAVRYFTASAQLAAVQAGLGQPEAAGRTLEALDAWRAQLGALPLLSHLTPQTAVWMLTARARALLSRDVGGANAHAEAALLRLHAARLDRDPEHAYLAMAAHLVAADCRWAAGSGQAALAHHRLALARYRAAIDGLAGRQPKPALVQTALAPLTELYEPFAQRLEVGGDPAGGIALRRAWIDDLYRLERTPQSPELVSARVALGQALARAGRAIEAAAELDGVSPATESPLPVPGEPCAWKPLTPDEALSARALTITATVRLRRDVQAAIAEGVTEQAVAAQAEARLREEAERQAAARAAQLAEAERQAAEAAEAAELEATERDRREAEQAVARRAAEEAAARAAAEERRRELAAARQRERTADPAALRVAESELPQAQQQLSEAGADLAAQAAAQERLAGLLRPLAQAAPARHAAELVTSLEALVSLRWRLGDPEGSKDAAREAKGWAAEVGR